ncbi:MAG: DNA-directed RNA polymerase [Candidatus Bathyarchaeota archaeon]|nr:MAG: DNA-directed RNA polymerase [Candidatus Bathyarchaeota archaeon]
MFSLITVKDVVRIPPEKFGQELEGVARGELNAKYEGMVSKQFGFIIAVTAVNVNPLGKIIPGDGATYHTVSFTLLSYTPSVQEVVEGEVVEVEDFGVFVRIGPIDALLHVSQVIDDFISYNPRQSALYARETGRILQQNDVIRARITVVSFTKGKASGKIGLTTRQPFLGKLDWIVEDVKKIQTPTIEQKGS